MSSNKTVFFLIGVLLTILGSSMLIPYAIQILQNENSHSFIGSSFITIFIGILFILSNLERQFRLNLQQTFLFSALALEIWPASPVRYKNPLPSAPPNMAKWFAPIFITGPSMTDRAISSPFI